MTGGEASANALKIEICNDFKKEFGIDLIDEDFEEMENGFEICFRDYDLNNYDKYHHSPLVENYRIENDGRESYILVYTFLEYDDYFGV